MKQWQIKVIVCLVIMLNSQIIAGKGITSYLVSNPSFEYDLTEWEVSSTSSVLIVTDVAYAGVKSCLLYNGQYILQDIANALSSQITSISLYVYKSSLYGGYYTIKIIYSDLTDTIFIGSIGTTSGVWKFVNLDVSLLDQNKIIDKIQIMATVELFNSIYIDVVSITAEATTIIEEGGGGGWFGETPGFELVMFFSLILFKWRKKKKCIQK